MLYIANSQSHFVPLFNQTKISLGWNILPKAYVIHVLNSPSLKSCLTFRCITVGVVSITKIFKKVLELNVNISSQKHDGDLWFHSLCTQIYKGDICEQRILNLELFNRYVGLIWPQKMILFNLYKITYKVSGKLFSMYWTSKYEVLCIFYFYQLKKSWLPYRSPYFHQDQKCQNKGNISNFQRYLE
jgi:hypothetical protein